MSESKHDSGSGFRNFLTEEVGLSGRPASALAEEIGSQDDLVEFLRENNKVSDVSGVGSRSGNRIWDWFKDERPEANRERLEQAEEYCTEFTTDHERPEDAEDTDGFPFAFVCPRCDEENPLKGDPREFKNRPFACVNCRWVPLLVAGTLEEFAQEEYDE